MNPTDQDIDTAGTEADPEVAERNPGKGGAITDPTQHPQGAPPSDEGQERGTTDPSTMHRAEDDGEAFARSPEFHDRPGSGKHAGVQPAGDGAEGNDALPRSGPQEPGRTDPDAVTPPRSDDAEPRNTM
jgi:hypothetical protein